MFQIALCFFSLIAFSLGALDVCVLGESSEAISFSGDDSVDKMQEILESMTGTPAHEQVLIAAPAWMFPFYNDSSRPKKHASPPRDYNAPMTTKEFNDLHYIVTTLGFKSLTKIYREKGSIEKAGDRIDNLHPFRFLSTIFTNDEMLAGIHNIRHRSLIWGEFFKGIKDSMREESERNNITEAQVVDFSSTLKINPDLIRPSLKQHQWDHFVDVLLANIKRNNDSGRYDM